jgi:hypothetical protein
LRYGRWNCERANSSVRSLFATTINVLEGLLEYERATRGTTESVAARKSSKEYLLKRYPFRRLTVGEPADEQFLLFLCPNRWRYDVYALSITSVVWRCSLVLTPIHDSEKAIDYVRSRCGEDGRWALESSLPGRAWFQVNDVAGKPSPWITLRALRVLKWWDDKNIATISA